MEVDREALLAAVKAANNITLTKHAVELFTKVWFVDDTVLAFNNTGTVFLIPLKAPALGGVDGKLLIQLLEKSGEDIAELTLTDKGQGQVQLGRSVTQLSLADPTDYVRKLAVPPTLGDSVLEFDCSMLDDDIELSGMLNVMDANREAILDLSSLSLRIGPEKLVIFSSDRSVINRSILKTKGSVEGNYLVPLDFMRMLTKLWSVFGAGSCAIDGKRIIVAGEDDALFYTPLLKSDGPPPFESAIGRLWEGGKIDTKTLVSIPDEFQEALKRAMLLLDKKVVKDANVFMSLSVKDNQLTMSTSGRGSTFEETIDFEHPDVQIKVTPHLLLKSLSHVDRIYMSPLGIAMFGPKRYSRFLAPN